MKQSFPVLLLLFIAGCASQPDDLSTTYVSPLNYQQVECDQLAREMQSITYRSCELYKIVENEADSDVAQMGIGLVLFWPTLFFLEGGDGPEAAEYSRLKGAYSAIRSVAIDKHCPCGDMPVSPVASLEQK